MANPAARKLGQLSAKKRREEMGEKAYSEYFKKLRNTPPKAGTDSLSTGDASTNA